jgi:eukaryotic-like serine/threonine-protein kinase
MIHRDVKPENVLLADDGRVKVADFGLARAISAETQHTATGGVLIGTVSYLSPELVVDGKADARSDVYAAGVVLYEMLTGRKPHDGESPIQVAYKHVHEDVPPPSHEIRGIPPYVDALVARATARDRELRPADARVLLHQVRRVRAALDEGLADDPDLTADLIPALLVQRKADDYIDYVREEVPTILTPAQVAQGGRTDDTSIFGNRPPAAPPRARPPAPRPVPRPRRSRRGPVLLVLVLLLAVAAGTGGWWFGAGRYVNTPGVIDLTAARAEAKVEAAGLHFRVGGRAYSETVAPGYVVSTDPRGGENVVRDGTVTAVLSRGPERHEVPTLRGMDLDAAQQALQQQGLAFGDATNKYSEKVAEGVVLSSDPKPTTELKRGAAVDLVVSRGPKPIDVPDVTGKDADAATRQLRKLGLEVDRSQEENSETVPEGDVISQDPRTGRLFKGDKVSLVVSKGPVLVPVPKVEGMGTEAAKQALAAAGFQVQTEKTQYYVGLEYVVNQSPGPGKKAPQGSTVTIYIV